MEKTLIKIIFISAFTLMTSCAHNSNIERKIYNSWERDIGYSQVVRIDNTLYISGITSEATTFNDQLTQIYETIRDILDDYGTGTDSILKEVIYTKDIESLKNAISVRKQFFKELHFPASTWVQIDRLYMEDHLLEVEIIAHIPKNRLN